MSNFATEYTRVQTNISNAYDSISSKGGILPVNQNSDNLASSIDSIPEGIDIQGIEASYLVAAGENISAGDFVEFYNEIYQYQNVPVDGTTYNTYQNCTFALQVSL